LGLGQFETSELELASAIHHTLHDLALSFLDRRVSTLALDLMLDDSLSDFLLDFNALILTYIYQLQPKLYLPPVLSGNTLSVMPTLCLLALSPYLLSSRAYLLLYLLAQEFLFLFLSLFSSSLTPSRLNVLD